MSRRNLTRSAGQRAMIGISLSEFAVARLSLVMFALIFVSLAVIILSVIAGDTEIITRVVGKRISAIALAVTATSGVILIVVSILGDVRHNRQIG